MIDHRTTDKIDLSIPSTIQLLAIMHFYHRIKPWPIHKITMILFVIQKSKKELGLALLAFRAVKFYQLWSDKNKKIGPSGLDIKHGINFNIQLQNGLFQQSQQQKLEAMIVIPFPHRSSVKMSCPSKFILNYIIDYEQALGRGNFSTVYRCMKSQEPDKQFAVKLINLIPLKQQKIEHLVRAEIDILMAINNKNVIGCRDVFWNEDWCYIFCDYFEGGNLEDRIKKVKAMKETPDVLEMVRNIFQGLAYLERSKIVHRDVKPANIFLRDDQAVVADLGFAKFFNEPFYDLQIGSPPYMAPQSLSIGYYSSKSDVWSFGVLLYELFHGQGPFLGCQDMKELIQKVKTPLSFVHLKGDLSIEMKQFIISCLQVDMDKRPKFTEIEQSWYYKRLFTEKIPTIPRSPLNTINLCQNGPEIFTHGLKDLPMDRSPVFTRLNKLKSDIKRKKDQNIAYSTLNLFEPTSTPQKFTLENQSGAKSQRQYFSYARSSRTVNTEENQEEETVTQNLPQVFSSQVVEEFTYLSLKSSKNVTLQPNLLRKVRNPEVLKGVVVGSNRSEQVLRASSTRMGVGENGTRSWRRENLMENRVIYTLNRQRN